MPDAPRSTRLIRRLRLALLLGLAGLVGWAVWRQIEPRLGSTTAQVAVQRVPFDPAFLRLSPAEIARLPVATRFDLPLGSEHGALTYNAQPFRITRHLGDDLNGIGGYHSDLGDPIYAAATGRVVFLGQPGTGWGNMVILAHRVQNAETGALDVIQTLYAHMDQVALHPGQLVRRGDLIGTVGTGGGLYLAHLHFEVRLGPYVNPSVGYADAPLNRLSPERFIAQYRGAGPEALHSSPRPDLEPAAITPGS